MTLPNLAGVIKAEDVYTKGDGSFSASYVTWAKTAQLMHQHAPGWDFSLREADEGGLVHRAPDGTGYIVGFFTGPDTEPQTSNFPYACMDRRNNPIPYEKVSARVLTDTHRRGYCAACAFFFSLGYELWANEEIKRSNVQPTAASLFETARDTIVQAASLEDTGRIAQRLGERYASGHFSQDENDKLLQYLVDKEKELTANG